MTHTDKLTRPLDCASCGRPLRDGIECRSCYPEPPASVGRDPEVQELYRRARRGMVAGGLAFPEIFESFSLLRVRRALQLYRDKGLDDPLLLRQLRRTRFLAIGLLVIGLTATLLMAVAGVG